MIVDLRSNPPRSQLGREVRSEQIVHKKRHFLTITYFQKSLKIAIFALRSLWSEAILENAREGKMIKEKPCSKPSNCRHIYFFYLSSNVWWEINLIHTPMYFLARKLKTRSGTKSIVPSMNFVFKWEKADFKYDLPKSSHHQLKNWKYSVLSLSRFLRSFFPVNSFNASTPHFQWQSFTMTSRFTQVAMVWSSLLHLCKQNTKTTFVPLSAFSK